jgi:hypothetical protein
VTIHARRFYTEDFLRWFFREHNSLHQLTSSPSAAVPSGP